MFTRFSHNIMFTLFSISVISVFQKFKQNRIFFRFFVSSFWIYL
jgi:hypothetical protein